MKILIIDQHQKNTEELLKLQDYKCANNPTNQNYLGPRDYFCPQWKYNNGFLEESHHVPFGFIFDIDHKKEYSKSEIILLKINRYCVLIVIELNKCIKIK